MHRRCRPLLGTFVEVIADHEEAIDAAFRAIARVHDLMSAHEPESELSQIIRSAHRGPVRASEWTLEVLRSATYWAARSNGAFDVVRAGGSALARGVIPLHPGQPSPSTDADWRALSIDADSVTLDRPAALDLGGIAKGFAVDRAIDALVDAGCRRALVNAGGDARGLGPEPWPLSVVHPLTRQALVAVELGDVTALATSAGLRGDGAQLEFDHLPSGDHDWISVSVLAPTACDADALTKIVWQGGAQTAALLAAAGAKAIAITRGGQIETIGERVAAAA
jgi:thiamine biosynthesis lipoprotein